MYFNWIGIADEDAVNYIAHKAEPLGLVRLE
jgi:hypothetical protein